MGCSFFEGSNVIVYSRQYWLLPAKIALGVTELLTYFNFVNSRRVFLLVDIKANSQVSQIN